MQEEVAYSQGSVGLFKVLYYYFHVLLEYYNWDINT